MQPFVRLFQRSPRFVSAAATLSVMSASLVYAGGVQTPSPTAGSSFYSAGFSKRPSAAAMDALGRKLFSDARLSASGKLACVSCHDARFAYGPPNTLAVQNGGAGGALSGLRAVPALRYQQNVPSFTEHYFDDDGNDSEDQGPAGGRTWDGRAASAHDQARLPLLSPLEMANASLDDVIDRLRSAPYAADFRDTFGADVFDSPKLAQTALLLSLEVFQQSPADFYPYNSKFDKWLRGKIQLSEQESRGLALFNDIGKGNCASCHQSRMLEGAFPAFTDFGYVAIGVPRNTQIPANADPKYFDLGLCGPLRTDLAQHTEYCGMFRSPSLRNVALRHVFFHNGAIHSLRDAVAFYAQRDIEPEKWYPRDKNGKIAKFDDLPKAYRANIDVEPPFDRIPGQKPALSDQEIDDIVAFLGSLTDDDLITSTPVVLR